jgi:hypothetical protein
VIATISWSSISYTRENNSVMLEKTYEFFTKQAGFNRDLTFTDRGFEQILKFLGGGSAGGKGCSGKPVLRYENCREAEKMIIGAPITGVY